MADNTTWYKLHQLDTAQTYLLFGYEATKQFAEKLTELGLDKWWFVAIEDWDVEKDFLTQRCKVLTRGNS